MKGINLLPHKQKKNAVNKDVIVVLERLSLVSLALIVFLSLALFALNYDTTLPSLKQQENSALTNLTLLHNKTAKILFIKDRLQNINTILQNRKAYENLIGQVNQMTPSDVNIENFSVSKGTVNIDFSSPSLLSLSNLLDTLTAMVQTKQTFKSLDLTGIIADNTTNLYTISVAAKLL